MESGNALLIVCDRRDPELGIGMDEDAFVDFMRKHSANFEVVSRWMSDSSHRPPEIGQNQLGFFLMWLRYEIKYVAINSALPSGSNKPKNGPPTQR